MHSKQFKSEGGGLMYTIRTLTPEEAAAEFADEGEEQEIPETTVGAEGETENETANQLSKVFERVAAGKSAVRTVTVTERKVNAPAAPETTQSRNETADALAKVIRKRRETS
jgi:hypothetical protein